jgi:hypothetical protein
LPRNAKTYKAEAVIELSAPMLLGSDFLGLLKPARIGGVDVHIVLPSFRRGIVQTGTVLHQRALVDWLDFFKERNPADDRDWPFGGVSSWDKGGQHGVGEFSAHRLLVMPKSPLTLREARNLKAAVDDWVELFEMWVEVVAREDLHRRRVWIEHQGRSAVVWLDRGTTLDGGIVAGEQQLKFNFGAAFAISPWQWGRMLVRASEDRTPPESHVLLRDARRAKNVGHHRRSVLDSATAAELALVKLREDSLAKTRADIAHVVRRNVQGIGSIARFLEKSGKAIPPEVDNEIGKPRNVAIHAGGELDEQTAEEALARAEQVVDVAYPWQRLLS